MTVSLNLMTLTVSLNLKWIKTLKNFSDVDCGDKTWDYGEDYKPIPRKRERGDLESSE